MKFKIEMPQEAEKENDVLTFIPFIDDDGDFILDVQKGRIRHRVFMIIKGTRRIVREDGLPKYFGLACDNQGRIEVAE